VAYLALSAEVDARRFASLYGHILAAEPGIISPGAEAVGRSRLITAVLSESPAAGQRSGESRLVGVLDVPSDRHSEGETSDLHVTICQKAGEKERRCLSFHVRIGRENDLFDVLQAFEKVGYTKLIGSDTALWRERPEQNMVQTAILTCTLDRLDVERLLDDAELGPVAIRIGAEKAGIDVSDGETGRAVEELVLDLEHGGSQSLGFRLFCLDEVLSEAGCGLGADAGESRQLADETGERVRHQLA
jgi:hypothetical protein